MTISGAELRALVREVVRDAVADLAQAHAAAPREHSGFSPVGPLSSGEKSRTDTVRIATDKDLDAFVRQLLRLFENPKTRADLRSGRLSFRLAGTAVAQTTAQRIESGAVTERHINDIATSGGSLTIGPRAVLTPLAREKARALGVTIHKERR